MTGTSTATSLSAPAYERVRARILEDIAAGEWDDDAALTVAQLTARYAVSQIPVREALQKLAGEGVLKLRSHRGARMPTFDAAFVADLYDVRGAIEAMLAARAAEQAGPERLEAIAAGAAAFEAAAGRGDAATALAANRAFHRLIDEAAGNAEALAIMDGRAALVYAARRRFGYGPGRVEAVIAQHRAIVAALRAGDPEAAARTTWAHCAEAKGDLIAAMAAAGTTGGEARR